ncbi:DNA repair protein RecO [Pseudogracilibacillus sp. SO30301A]|uniref:DNA repair protein RecO n=1 Tax=Pseudogracilibacillus sp. SO30301A TaxID=3098291 RepID=UPI00300E6055
MLKQLEGIVLKTHDYGETHKILSIFTKELGKISAISRGANKPKSRLSAISQVFIQGDFLIYVTKGLSTIQQGQIIRSHRYIREDIEKTAYASYIIELTDKTIERTEPDPFIYDQLDRTLNWIDENEAFLIPVMMYELKLYKKGGFAPVTSRCVNCGNTIYPFAFSIQEGGLLCEQCKHLDQRAVFLENAIARLLPILENVGIERVGNISVKDYNIQLLRNLLNNYYDQYGGYSLKSRKFLSQLDLFK